MTERKASDLFVACLEAEGVEYIFGVPGEENADIMISLDATDKVRFVLTRHEQGAAFMADVYGRLTGRAGVCLGTLGPGATNLVTGVADANMDRAPCVVLTGQADTNRLHKESHQAMDVVGMFKPITKWAWSIANAENIPEVIHKAFRLAEEEKPGACHIELPENIAEHTAKAQPMTRNRLRRPVADDKIADRAFEQIRLAKSPIVLAGNGAIRKRASKQLRRLAELTGLGVASTFMGKGAVSRHDPHCLFTVGLQSRDVISCAIDAADLVITVGYDAVEYLPEFWNPQADKTVIHLDFDEAESDHHYQPTVEMVGDIAHSLWMLCERFEALTDKPTYDFTRQARARLEMQEDLATHSADDTEGSIRPQKALWDLREALGPDDIVLSDVGAHKMWIARHYHCETPGTCLMSNGFCSMGFALPGAIAAKLVYPERNIVAVCGDGGFLMNVQEMETAKRLETDIVVMVWEDQEYGLIAWKQWNTFGRHTDLSFANPDFALLAKAFQWNYFHTDKSRDLRATLDAALAASGPSLVVIPIDYRENRKLSERLGNLQCSI
ncbi:MAG: acetolactate synthase-1/2/3 large subunit [Hyphomicrobiaceae bacterium]|jgi:acetolactate synthase-1/2/3 large subunit